MERRHEVLALARKYKFLILEGISLFVIMDHCELINTFKMILITSFTTVMKPAAIPTSPWRGRTIMGLA